MHFSSELSLFSPYIQSPLAFDTRKSRLRATAKIFVPQALALSSTVTHAPKEQAPMSKDTVEPAATISVKDLEAPATPQETHAAIVIQVAYRRALQRRETHAAIVIQVAYRRALQRRAALPPKDERVKLWYSQCVDSQVHLRGSRTYLQHFLGPLVHVLIWADAMVRLLKNRRDRARKKFRPANLAHHTQIEEFMERLAVCK